ncbi:MAG TPA: hypothetical protein VKW06_08440 [Candidatus Angelobacter sp.]|nr:hypothetical protein [Candidatus Angelobacter sp.]
MSKIPPWRPARRERDADQAGIGGGEKWGQPELSDFVAKKKNRTDQAVPFFPFFVCEETRRGV